MAVLPALLGRAVLALGLSLGLLLGAEMPMALHFFSVGAQGPLQKRTGEGPQQAADSRETEG